MFEIFQDFFPVTWKISLWDFCHSTFWSQPFDSTNPSLQKLTLLLIEKVNLVATGTSLLGCQSHQYWLMIPHRGHTFM